MTTNSSERSIEYLPIESAMVVLDLADQDRKDHAWLAESGAIRRITKGLKDAGIRNLQARCSTWAAAEEIIGSIDKAEQLRITCRLPFSELPKIAKTSRVQPIQLLIQMPSTSRLRTGTEAFTEPLQAWIDDLPTYVQSMSLLVPVSKDSLDYAATIASKLHEELGVSVVLSPRTSPVLSAADPARLSWQETDALYCQVIDYLRSAGRADAILMDLGFLPTRLLTEHPCNGYACSGMTCHSGKSNLPRRLVVLADGTLLPENRYANPRLAIGNVHDGSISGLLTAYDQGESHKLFLNVAKKVFVDWVQTCPYRVVPWAQLFAEVSEGWQ